MNTEKEIWQLQLDHPFPTETFVLWQNNSVSELTPSQVIALAPADATKYVPTTGSSPTVGNVHFQRQYTSTTTAPKVLVINRLLLIMPASKQNCSAPHRRGVLLCYEQPTLHQAVE